MLALRGPLNYDNHPTIPSNPVCFEVPHCHIHLRWFCSQGTRYSFLAPDSCAEEDEDEMDGSGQKPKLVVSDEQLLTSFLFSFFRTRGPLLNCPENCSGWFKIFLERVEVENETQTGTCVAQASSNDLRARPGVVGGTTVFSRWLFRFFFVQMTFLFFWWIYS